MRGHPAIALIASNGDLAIHALATQLNRDEPTVGLVGADTVTALDWLAADGLLAVGVLGDCVAPPGAGLARIQVAYQQFGPAAARGKSISTPLAVVGRGQRLASFPEGSDLRNQVDGVLRREGGEPRRAHAQAVIATSYGDVAAALLREEATVGVLTAAWAARCGLSFLPLGSRPLGLVTKAESLGHPALVRCWHVLQSVAFAEALAGVEGIELSNPGHIQHLLGEVEPSTEPVEGRRPSRARWVLVLRSRGANASDTFVELAEELEARGLPVAGFVQRPRRRKGEVVAYEARRLGSADRVVVARRQRTPAAGTKLTAQSFRFEPEGFARAAKWLQQDGRRSSVLFSDGVGKLESRGGGHQNTLVWALRQRAPKVVVVACRREQSAVLSSRLGLEGRQLAVIDAAAGATERAQLVERILASSGGGGDR